MRCPDVAPLRQGTQLLGGYVREYYVWTYEYDEVNAVIDMTPEIINDDVWRLAKGQECSSWFPSEVEFHIDSDTGLIINDAIHTTLVGFPVISSKLRKILESTNANYEFFSIKVKDHQGEMIKQSYFVANLIDKIECVDREKSTYVDDNMFPGMIEDFEKLILDYSKIPDTAEIFRLAEKPRTILVSKELALKIKVDEKCTGPTFVYSEQWDGFAG